MRLGCAPGHEFHRILAMARGVIFGSGGAHPTCSATAGQSVLSRRGAHPSVSTKLRTGELPDEPPVEPILELERKPAPVHKTVPGNQRGAVAKVEDGQVRALRPETRQLPSCEVTCQIAVKNGCLADRVNPGARQDPSVETDA